CNPMRIGRTISNNIRVHLDITSLEENIKTLCKIHFGCSKINGHDYVTMPVEKYFMLLNSIAKQSRKVVDKIISETEAYVFQKRTEQKK
ncbi:MAG: hypothetical protein QG594_166, partial [Bacteroidota bacterium]|nr:hypothetical protein [Bacteroidota bacterium]